MCALKLFRRYGSRLAKGKIYIGDALDFLHSLDNEVADLVFLDPPFNLGKRYTNKARIDRRPNEEYKSWLFEILNESERVLKPGGALYLYHLPEWALRFGGFFDGKLNFRHWIAVSMKNAFARGSRLYPAHYALLYYTKGAPSFFKRPRVPPQICRNCGAFIKDYGGYRPIIERQGVNVSDVWDDFSPVRHKTTKTRVANELSVRFMDRIIEISGAPGSLYVDPFAGSGSGVIAAIQGRMQFLACDIAADSCAIIAQRVIDTKRDLALRSG